MRCPQAEVKFLGRLRHENLVRLLGYCAEREHRLLVYELMPRGSLDRHLFSRQAPVLPWATRLRIALGAARGLAYLHEEQEGEGEQPVIYRDFKTPNVLLDHDFTAKLSDFGLATVGPEEGRSYVSTRVLGTYGYAAPEYMLTGATPLSLFISSLRPSLHLLLSSVHPLAHPPTTSTPDEESAGSFSEVISPMAFFGASIADSTADSIADAIAEVFADGTADGIADMAISTQETQIPERLWAVD
eukprot:jgi/Mesen1/3569/ME000199S02721